MLSDSQNIIGQKSTDINNGISNSNQISFIEVMRDNEIKEIAYNLSLEKSHYDTGDIPGYNMLQGLDDLLKKY